MPLAARPVIFFIRKIMLSAAAQPIHWLGVVLAKLDHPSDIDSRLCHSCPCNYPTTIIRAMRASYAAMLHRSTDEPA